MARKDVRVIVPAPRRPEPLIYRLAQHFDIVVTARSPAGGGTSGSILLELEGEEDRIAGGIAWLVEQGVAIDPADVVPDVPPPAGR